MILKPSPIYDFYYNEAPVNFAAMVNPRPVRVIFQASQQQRGTRQRWIDPQVYNFVDQARANGHKIGLYHFLSPNGIAEQAALFMTVWNKVGGADMAPQVDVEVDLNKYYNYPGSTIKIGNAVWQGHIKTFCDLISAGTGKTPIIYTNEMYWLFACTRNALLQMVPPPWTQDYPLWVAQYPTFPDAASAPAALPLGWKKWAMWQYSDSGRQNGFLANDLNIPSDWYAEELGLDVTPPPPPPPPPSTVAKTHDVDVYSDGSVQIDGHPAP